MSTSGSTPPPRNNVQTAGRILSGIQPTGNLHLGNYLGAIRNWVGLQKDYECFFLIVDLHAITLWQDPAELRRATREVAAGMIASGVDPVNNALFVQSHVPAHAELAWVFNCVARIGWLNRMTQFKDKAGKNRENASAGLYVYPNLMAADILVYKATHVPVGEDQKQHLELTRDIAQKFNNDYGKAVFPLPEPVIRGPGMRVMSLRDGAKKMSKSDESDYSRLNMTDDRDAIALKLQKAKTDPLPLPATEAELEGRPEAANLINIYAALTDKTIPEVLADISGLQFSAFKSRLTDIAVSVLGPINAEMQRLMNDPAEIDKVLSRGADKANAVAGEVLKEVYDTVGFLPRR
ncbi:MAG: tryptophan--tRNA ligase [Rhodospirillaceae bacterium]|nr:tryptophan--tRNA ligase [Rhodospirillaceae bacterium]